jgi:protein phosphatase
MSDPTAPETHAAGAPKGELPIASDVAVLAKDERASASDDAPKSAKSPSPPAASDKPADDAKATDAKAADAKVADVKDAEAKPADAGEAKTAAVDVKADDAKAGDARASDAKAGDAKAGDAKAGDAKTGDADAKAPDASKEPQEKAEVVIEKPKPIQLRLFGRTDVGQVREHNEDNFIVADLSKPSRGLMEGDRNQLVGARGTLLGVCDGMGGAAAGEVASQLAVDIVYQKMTGGDAPLGRDDLAMRLVQAIEAAGLRIFTEAKLDRTRRGMGTTATIAALMDDHLFLGQVGDSRGYILRGDRLVQVTRDQSLVNQLIEAGQLTEEEAETFEHNNIILQALGTADTVQVDLTYVKLLRGDTLMLCSDGLSGMVRNDEIREVLRTVEDPLEVCKVLTDRANQAGGHDNITVVVAKFEGDGIAAPTTADIDGLKYAKYPLPEPTGSPIAEPSRRMKDLNASKVSSRPPARSWTGGPEIEVTGDGYDSEDEEDGHSQRPATRDDPIHIPTDGAPQWLVIMMITSALLCVTIAGYYLLR